MISIFIQSEVAGKLALHSRHVEGEEVVVGGCKFLVRAAGCFVIDLSGTITVNGRPITGPRALYRDDVVQDGSRVMLVEHVAGPPDPIATQLVTAILAGDLASREVFADWLEEQGDPRRAELLRLQERVLELSPTDPQYAPCTRRLRELAIVTDVEWRVLIGRPRVERCSIDCTKNWSELAPTELALQRRCPDCRNFVAYCESMPGDRTPRRIVIDAGVHRIPGDLD